MELISGVPMLETFASHRKKKSRTTEDTISEINEQVL